MDKLPYTTIWGLFNFLYNIKTQKSVPKPSTNLIMTKKALKSLEADVRKPRSQNKITFNNSSFSLGSLLVITD